MTVKYVVNSSHTRIYWSSRRHPTENNINGTFQFVSKALIQHLHYSADICW